MFSRVLTAILTFRLEQAHGLDSDHDDPNLSQQIHSSLSKSVDSVTPADLKTDMKGNKMVVIIAAVSE